jgi:serine/threonine protein kinase/Tfp pilus assembly protein PilF
MADRDDPPPADPGPDARTKRQEAGSVETTPTDLSPTRPASTTDSGTHTALPERIGSYKILRLVGEGGMGAVYEAEQEKPRRRVALKVIRQGLTTQKLLRRFELESQVLGRLQHSGIAQIFEAGTADSPSGPQPFFAMEYIQGQSLSQYIRTDGPCSRERLELVAQICDAVHHAHQKGVIHRDLKPGNIIVDAAGHPKILDFGVARATDSDIQLTTMHTDVGQLIGTLSYMSPEQVAADPNELDTRSDVYALGVILFEALTGTLPYDLSNRRIHEAARVIQEQDPTSLSSVGKAYRGDIETIVAKALEKDKSRRYESAEQLAADIRRFLHDEPIVARPPSTLYQLRKFAKRNKVLVTGVAASLVALSAGLIVSLNQYVRAESQRKAAEKARDESNAVTEFLIDVFKISDPSEARGNTVTAREILDRGAARIEAELQEDPEVQATLMSTMGRVYESLGLYESAQPLLERALERRIHVLGTEHLSVAESQQTLANLLRMKGNYEDAGLLYRQALDLRRRLVGEEHPAVAGALNGLANLLYAKGDYEGAEPLYREALALSRQLQGEEHADVARGLNNLAIVLLAKGDYEGAEPLFREALSMRRSLFGEDHPRVAVTQHNLAGLLVAKGDYDGAEALQREALAMQRKLLGDEHPEVAQSLHNLANVLAQKGDYDGAKQVHRETLAMNRRLLGDEHPEVARSLSNLAFLLSNRGEYAEAEHMYREALALQRKIHGGEHPDVASSLNNLGNCLEGKGDYEGAGQLYREALAMRRRLLGDEHPDVAQSLHNVGLCLSKKGDQEGAEQLYREALAMRRRLLGDEHPAVAHSLEILASSLEGKGDYDGAELLFREALVMRREFLGDEHPDVARALFNLGTQLVRKQDYENAKPVLQEAIAIWEKTPGPNEGRLADSFYNLACLSALQGQRDEALDHLRGAVGHGFSSLWVTQDPDLASLHGDPEFEAIVEELERRNREKDTEAAAAESE